MDPVDDARDPPYLSLGNNGVNFSLAPTLGREQLLAGHRFPPSWDFTLSAPNYLITANPSILGSNCRAPIGRRAMGTTHTRRWGPSDWPRVMGTNQSSILHGEVSGAAGASRLWGSRDRAQ